jgi:hypothetical protein
MSTKSPSRHEQTNKDDHWTGDAPEGGIAHGAPTDHSHALQREQHTEQGDDPSYDKQAGLSHGVISLGSGRFMRQAPGSAIRGRLPT